MTKHSMTYERGGMRKPKKKAVKASKKSSALQRKAKTVGRQVGQVLSGVGFVMVVVWIIQLVRSW